MTCIAAVAHEGKVTMGGDSAGVNAQEHLQLRNEAKVFKQGELLVGASGLGNTIHRLQFLQFPALPADYTVGLPSTDLYRWACTNLLTWLRTNLGEAEGVEILVGVRGRIFHIYRTSQVTEELAPFEACGSGAQVARGALYTMPDNMPPYERVQRALAAAERFCSGVRGPFDILEVGQ